MNQALRLG